MENLAALSALDQLRAGRLTRRLTQLLAGLVLYGVSLAMLVRAGLGLDPWDVFHVGVAGRTGLSIGQVVIVVSFAVLILWIPIRQWPGLGTIVNAIVIGLATDLFLSLLDAPHALAWRIVMMAGGVAANGLATSLYIGAQLGPGPRDGLMTGLVRRTGRSVRVVRTALELAVLTIGWLLGGTVGIGTVVYALSIGPLVHLLLPHLIVKLPERPGYSVPVRRPPRTSIAPR